MIGLAKTAEIPKEMPTAQAPPPPTGLAGFDWEGIPIDVLRHFNMELGTIPTKDLEMLKDITTWAKSKTIDEPSIGNVLQQISKIQRQLGNPAINERSYEKTWRFIKAQRIIDEMTKRQESLRTSAWI